MITVGEEDLEAAFVVKGRTQIDPNSTDVVGPLVRLEPVVVVVGASLPLRGVSRGIDAVRDVLNGKLHPDLPMYTMRHKGQTYVLTLADLRLVRRGPK